MCAAREAHGRLGRGLSSLGSLGRSRPSILSRAQRDDRRADEGQQHAGLLHAAQSLAEAACAAAQARGGSLRDAAAADPRISGALDPRVLDALFTAPAPGAADAMVDRTLAAWAARPRGQPA